MNRTSAIVKMPLVNPPFKDPAFLRALADAENSNRVGYSHETNQWVPHTSLEGGTDTIGYGHKLSKSEARGNYVIVKGKKVPFNKQTGKGLTDREIEDLFNADVREAYGKASSTWDSYKDDTMPTFYQLPNKYKGILVDIVFNVGSMAPNGVWEWPKLRRAMLENNDREVRKQSVRYFFDSHGKKHPLTKRTNLIANALGLNT